MSGYRQIKFKSSGENDLNTKKIEKRQNQISSLRPVGFKTPLELGNDSSGLFKMHFNLEDQISDNLKNLIMTNKGERLCFSDIGANLDDIVYKLGEEAADTIAMQRIRNVIQKYMPFVIPDTFSSKIDKDNRTGSRVILTLNYKVPSINNSIRSIDISLNLSN